MDLQQYRPSEEVLEKLRAVRLVAVVGPSGSGKTTLINRAAAQGADLQVVISDTSRARRSEELDGRDYFFRTKAAMLKSIERREYVQVAPSNSGDFYATHIQSYPREGLAVMAIWAEAMPAFQKLPFESLQIIFVVPPSFEQWQQRLNLHAFDPQLQAKRLAEARRSFTYALTEPSVWFVINDSLQEATHDFIELAHGGPSDELKAKQASARRIIQTILQRLSV